MKLKHKMPAVTPSGRLKYDRYLTPLDVWSIAFGCIVGWGSFVMPGTDFLPMAGPFGSFMALGVGALIMLIIGHNYSYLMKKMPGTGGTYLYTKKAFGKDHAFICSWFLSLSYVTIVFLNATALFVMARTVAGNALQFGFHYQVAGYDIYFGELLLSTFALVVVALLFISGKPLLQILHTILAVILCGGVLIITTIAIFNVGHIDIFSGFDTPDYNPTIGFATIVLLAPWAYVGFDVPALETVHFNFPLRRSGRIIALSIIFGGLTYASLTLLSICEVPEGFASWQEYIGSLGSLSGVQSIPPFFAAQSLLGQFGLAHGHIHHNLVFGQKSSGMVRRPYFSGSYRRLRIYLRRRLETRKKLRKKADHDNRHSRNIHFHYLPACNAHFQARPCKYHVSGSLPAAVVMVSAGIRVLLAHSKAYSGREFQGQLPYKHRSVLSAALLCPYVVHKKHY